jgi:general secretion pathway protein G
MRKTTGADGRRGFTLIEVLAVMAIIAVLAGIVLGVAGYASRKADRTRAQSQMEAIKNALEQYRVDFGRYPNYQNTPLTNTALRNSLTNYLGGASVTDPWGRSYVYDCTNRYAFLLRSGGPDTTLGNEDDLGNLQGSN